MFSRTMKQLLMFAAVLVATSGVVQANDTLDRVNEARLEGQLWGIFAVNRELNPFDLEIEVSGSTATLSGEVDEDAKRDLAEEIAMDVNGIDRVNNNISVNRELPLMDNGERSFGDRVSDATTTARVRGRLLLEDDVPGMSISVSTENDVVTLEGEVESRAEVEKAEQVASETDGVERVINRLVVGS